MFDESFINQLNSWNEKTLLKKIKFNRGIERETLRVSKDGSISKRPHPKSLGSALTNSYITTDFAEALIELVTPKFDNVDVDDIVLLEKVSPDPISTSRILPEFESGLPKSLLPDISASCFNSCFT